MKLSILTSTYNRAKMLPDLYESLKDNLKYDVNFEWLIMDDGSTDNTKEVVEEFINENKMDIKYFYQENQGKMIAINNLVDIASGDYIMDCDSDDYFAKNAFKIIKENIDKLVIDQELYALLFLKCDVAGEISGEKFKEDNYKTTMFDLYLKDDVKGEKIILFNGRIRKQFKHKIENGEKFITEARMYHEMDKQYKVLCINSPIIIGEYLKDGYTSNIRKIFVENPKGYLKYFEEILSSNTEGILFKKRLYIIKHYILFCYLTNSKNILKQVKDNLNKLLIILLYLPGCLKTKLMFSPKKILFSSWTLEVGGIETALVNLLNEMSKKYKVTLVLEEKRGAFLEKVNKNVKILEYKPNTSKNILIRKGVNLFKRIMFILKNKNRYDFAVSFATYSRPGSFIARTASKNNLLWVHSNYMVLYNNDIEKIKDFFNAVKYDKFKNIVCISEDARKAFETVFPEKRAKIKVINNLVNYEEIIEKSKEEIDLKKEEGTTTFLSVCRHEERAKKLTRLIEAAKLLKEENFKFKILFVGEGEDTELYKQLVKEYSLENYIIFCGMQKNPYPYFKVSDCVILTSEYEGYPVIYIEAKVLQKPIITTNVSDSMQDIKNKFGIVVDKNVESIKEAMKEFIENGYKITEKFQPKEFNKNIIKKIEKLL